MARVSESEVERLQAEVSVERLIVAHGIQLTFQGDERIAICPFHEGPESPLVVTPKTNAWTCVACAVGGGPIEWVMKAKGMSHRHAVESLRADPPGGKLIDGEPLFDAEVDNDTLLNVVADFYHRALKGSGEGLAYLDARGLKSAEMIEHFHLGLADRTLGYRLPDRRSRGGRRVRERLQEVGVLRDTGHELFSGSLVVPIFDADGVRVRGMYGRKVTEGLRPGTPLHVYSPEPALGVWNERGLGGGEVVLTSSLIDALTFWSNGLTNVTATCGLTLPDDHRRAFTERGVKRIYLAFKRDDAGDAAVEKIATELNTMGIEVWRVLFPLGMDANDYALAGKSLADAVRGAEWIGKGSAITAGKIVMDVSDQPSTATVSSVEPHLPKTLATAPMSATTSTDEMLFTFGDRRWRVRGIEANTSYGDLRVNVLVTREHAGFHIDTLDLYSARHRLAFVKQAAIEIDVTDAVVKAELGSILLELEARVDEQIRTKLAPVAKTPAMTDAEEAEAMALLRDPKLTERITADLDRLGLIGEISNKLIAYLVTISRKLDNPLAVVVQSSSAAGKTSLVDAVLDLVPPEDRVSYSAMTGQSLFYMGDTDLKHKVLSVSEGEGAKSASYPLKLLQSEGKLSIASTGKDPVSGRLVTHTYTVTGPVATVLTTTAIDLDDELVNRCLVLAVDEGAEQTRAIHVAQRSREALAGVLARRDRDRIVRVHRNAQRLLRPIVVVNPFADTLAFTDTRTRSRRDHAKLLTLVRAITLLHQHQRPVKIVEHEGESVEFIEATTVDIELATKLLADVLAAPENELPPVTRNILAAIESFVTARAKSEAIPASDVRFTKRDLRAHVGLGHAQVTTHLQRLEAMEYVHVHRSERTFRYALYDRDLSGQKPICRGGVGHLSEAKVDTPGIRDHEGKGAFQPNGRPSGVHVNGAVDNPGRT